MEGKKSKLHREITDPNKKKEYIRKLVNCGITHEDQSFEYDGEAYIITRNAPLWLLRGD